MKKIEITNYQAIANCKTHTYSSRESFYQISEVFEFGKSYGIISDYGMGSWGLTTSLCGKGEDYSGQIYVDDKLVEYTYFKDKSMQVFQNVFDEIPNSDNLSVREHIAYALNYSGIKYKPDDIKTMFGLTDERFERTLNLVGIELWRISIAIGFALDKDIYIFPWLNKSDLKIFTFDQKPTDLLLKNNKLVIVPTSCRKIKKDVDKIIKLR